MTINILALCVVMIIVSLAVYIKSSLGLHAAVASNSGSTPSLCFSSHICSFREMSVSFNLIWK